MNIFVRKYKLFRYDWRGKEQKLASLSSIWCMGALLLNSIIRLIFKERIEFSLAIIPIIIVSIQFVIFLRYKKFLDKEGEDLKLAGNSHEKFSRELLDGYLNVNDVDYTDYMKYKMYLAYPLKEWTPIWETLAKKD